MSTTLTTFAADEVSLRYKEDFVTEKLNRKLLGIVPKGLYRGFRISTSLSSDEITILGDDNGTHAASYQGSDFDLSIYRFGGDFTGSIPITGGATTYVVAIIARYAIGSTTSATLELLTTTEWNALTDAQRDEYLALGTVTSVASGGVIPAANITTNYRDQPWDNLGDAKEWFQANTNSSFEDTDTGGAYTEQSRGWLVPALGTYAIDFTFVDTDARSGAKSMEWNVNTGALNVTTGTDGLVQWIGAPVVPGQQVRARVYYRKMLATLSGSAAISFAFGFEDASHGFLSNTLVYSTGFHTDPIMSDFSGVFETTISVPSGAAYLKSISLGTYVVGSASTGPLCRFDDFEVRIEPLFEMAQTDMVRGTLAARQLVFGADNPSLPQALPKITTAVSGVNSTLELTRTDKDTTSVYQPALELGGQLRLGAALQGSTAQRSIARTQSSFYESTGPFPTPTDLTLQTEFVRSGVSASATRVYVDGEGALWTTVNAQWTGAQWEKDEGAQESYAWVQDPTNNGQFWIYRQRVADPDPWTTWAHRRFSVERNGVIYANNTNGIGGDPAYGFVAGVSTAAYPNMLEFLGYHGAENETEASLSAQIPFTFTATNGRVDVTSFDGIDRYLTPGYTLVEILTPAAQAGLYIITTVSPPLLYLATPDGNLPSPVFPTTGGGNLRILNSAMLGLFFADITGAKSSIDVDPFSPTYVWSGAVINAPTVDVAGTQDLTSLVLTAPEHPFEQDHASFIRGFKGANEHTFRVSSEGHIYSYGGLDVDGGDVNINGVFSDFNITTAYGDYLFETGGRSRVTQIMPYAFFPARAQVSASYMWESQVFGVSPNQGYVLTNREIYARLFLDLGSLFPEGSIINTIKIMWDPFAAYAGGQEMTAYWFSQSIDFVPGTSTPTISGPNDTVVQSGSGLHVVTMSPSLTIDRPASSSVAGLVYTLCIQAGNGTGDKVWGVQVEWQDISARSL